MNLYKYHTDPESLDHHDYAISNILHVAWDIAKRDKKELAKKEHLWATDPHFAYAYAVATHQRFKAGEDVISKDPEYARMYASNVITGPWSDGEDAISKDAMQSFIYAFEVLNSRFKKGEAAIRSDERLWHNYCYRFNIKE